MSHTSSNPQLLGETQPQPGGDYRSGDSKRVRRFYRVSYWKTTVVSFGAFLLTMVPTMYGLAAYGLAAGEFRVPVLGWNLTIGAFLYWPLLVLLLLLSLLCLLTAVGGGICLYSDAQENRPAERGA